MRVGLFQHQWRTQKAIRWASTGLFIFITAFMWAPSLDGLIGIYALAFFLPMLLVLPWQKPQLNHYGGMPTLIATLFAGYATLSVLWGSSPQDAGYFFGVFLLLFAWLAGVAWLHQQAPLNTARLLQWLIGCGIVIGLSALVVFYTQNDLSTRLSSWTVARNPIVTAQIFGVAALLAWVQSWRASEPKESWGFFSAALLAFLPVIMAQSRGPLLALAVTLFLALILLRPRLTVWLPQGVLLLFALGLYYGIVGIPADILERGIGLTYREEVWLHIIQRLPDNFWFGIGLTKDTDIDLQIPGYIPFHHAHNAYLDTLFRTGIVGLLLLLTHLFYVLRHWRINPQLLPLYLWLIYGVVCVCSNTRILFWQLDAKWLLYWIPAGLIAATHITRSTHPTTNNR